MLFKDYAGQEFEMRVNSQKFNHLYKDATVRFRSITQLLVLEQADKVLGFDETENDNEVIKEKVEQKEVEKKEIGPIKL